MKKESTEVLVGMFVLIGLLCVAYLTINLGRLNFIKSDQFVLSAKFDSVSGIKKGANVELGGIKVGSVSKMYLDMDDQVAVLELSLRGDLELGDDVIASVKSTGLIGDRYVDLTPGGSEEYLQNGDYITETESSIDLTELISKYAFGGVD